MNKCRGGRRGKKEGEIGGEGRGGREEWEVVGEGVKWKQILGRRGCVRTYIKVKKDRTNLFHLGDFLGHPRLRIT